MNFFATYWTWLDGQLQQYISDNVARVAAALAPAIAILGTIYVIVWGYLQLTGAIDQPLVAGLKRIITLAVVLGVSLQLWMHNDLLVDTFYMAPAKLAAAVIGSSDPVHVVDTIWSRGATAAENLESRWTMLSGWDFLIMAWVIRLMIGALCVYTMFLIALSKVALAVLLALGPLFIVMLLFEQTHHYFRAWIAQLSNYALVTILTVMICALILGLVERYATLTSDLGVSIRAVDALDMLLVCALAILFMMQVTQIAAGLAAGGAGLNSFGSGQRGLSAGLGVGRGIGILGAVAAVRAGRYLHKGGASKNGNPKARTRRDEAGGASEPRLMNRNSIEPQR